MSSLNSDKKNLFSKISNFIVNAATFTFWASNILGLGTSMILETQLRKRTYQDLCVKENREVNKV
jgi:hypothetical protein